MQSIFANTHSFDDPDGVEIGEALRSWSPAVAYLFDRPGMRDVPRFTGGWDPSNPREPGAVPEHFIDRLNRLLHSAERGDPDCCPHAKGVEIFGLESACLYPDKSQCLINRRINFGCEVRALAVAIVLDMTNLNGAYELRWIARGDARAQWQPMSPSRRRMLRPDCVVLDASQILVDDQCLKVRVFRSARRKKPGPRPSVGPRVAAAMRSDLNQDRITRARLRQMKQEEMRVRYGASAATCRRECRKQVLSDAGRDPIPAS